MTDLTGWVLVPRVATDDVLEAARNAAMSIQHNKEPWFPMTDRRLKRAIAAAIAASPSPPVDVAGLVARIAQLEAIEARLLLEANAAFLREGHVRSENAIERAISKRWLARAESAEQECVRMREALERIVCLSMSQFMRMEDMVASAIEIAADALTHQKPDTPASVEDPTK